VGPTRAVAAGLVAPLTMFRAMWVVFGVAFACGLGLLAWGGPWLLVIGVASIGCGIAYTGGPWPLGYHGLGDVFVFLFFGLVAVGATYFVQTQHVTPDALLAAVPIGLLAANILVVNNYRDMETDAIAGKRTLVVRFGRAASRVQHAGSILVALIVPILFWLRDGDAWRLLPLAIAPLAWQHVRRLRMDEMRLQRIALLAATGQLLAAYAVLMAAGFLL
jgi:1,4-dihydroxy-2-naphthoate octaprenyltransferase